MRKVIAMLAGALLGSAMLAGPADAVTFSKVSSTFNFTGGSSKTTGAAGNTISQTVDGITVTASAWSIDSTIGTPFHTHGTASSLDLRPAYLGDYSAGLGVTDYRENGSSPGHTIDNVGAYDFILLSFSQPVQLLFGTLNAFQAYPFLPADNDAWVSFSDVAPGSTPLTDPKVFANMILHATEVNGTGSSAKTFLNPGMNTGTEWIIGADAFDTGLSGGNLRFPDDAFKLAGFSVQAPVPEPSVWASMILGLGMIGSVLRGRRRAGRAALAA